MSGGGYLHWDYPFVLGQIWLDGRWYAIPPDGLDWEPAPGVFVLDTHAGTNIMQKPYTGAAAPLLADKWKFTLALFAEDQDDWLAVNLSRARARPVAFVPGLWAVDIFPAGQATGQLSRPTAFGIAPGAAPDGTPINASTVRVYLNGARDDAAATVSGQSVAFTGGAAPGEIAVHYMAAFFVCFTPGPKHSLKAEDWNAMPFTVELEEIRQGSFG
jgi:hypothetical protein